MPIAESEEFSSLLAELKRSTAGEWADLFLERRCLLRTTLRSDRDFVTTETWDSGAGARVVDPRGRAILASSTGEPMRAAEEAAARLCRRRDQGVDPNGAPGFVPGAGVGGAGRDPVRSGGGLSPDRQGGSGLSPDLADWVDSEEGPTRRIVTSMMEAVARECGPSVRIVLEAKISCQEIAHQTSGGGTGSGSTGPVRDLRTGLVVDAVVTGADGEVRRRWAAAGSASLRTSLDPGGAAGAIGERLRRLGESVPSLHGEFPVVLGCGSGGLLIHEAIGHLLEGDLVRCGGTCLAPQQGRRGEGSAPPLFSPLLTVHDDPGRLDGRGAYAVDDEGVSPVRATLVEGGRVRGWVGDRWTSPASTGHGRRQSHRDLPMPRLACTFAERGPHDPEEIIRDTVRGVYLDELRYGFADPISGDFTLVAAEGSLIEGGRLTAPLRDIVISGNVFESLALIDRVGTDLSGDGGAHSCVRGGQSVTTIVGAPTVRIARIRVNGIAASL